MEENKVYTTINIICDWIQEEIANEESCQTTESVACMISALAELVKAEKG